MALDREQQRSEDQEPDGHSGESVEVLDPGLGNVEERRVDALRYLRRVERRDPAIEALRPVGAAEPRTGSAHETTDSDQQIRRERGDEREALKAVEPHDVGVRCVARTWQLLSW